MKTYIGSIYLSYLLAAAAFMAWTLASGFPRHFQNLALPHLTARARSGVDMSTLPCVLRDLSLKDSFLRQRYIALCEALPEGVSRYLPQLMPAAEVRANAAGLVGQFGPAAKTAVPQLINLLRDGVADANAAGSLALLGPAAEEAVPALIEALQREKPFAATALAAIGKRAASARPALEAAALTGPLWLRHEAVNALVKLDAAS